MIIEKITGTTYEAAMRDLVLGPLGLDDTLFFMTEIMTRRFAVGHNQEPDGTISPTRVWAMARANAAAGGMSATAADQLRWAQGRVAVPSSQPHGLVATCAVAADALM